MMRSFLFSIWYHTVKERVLSAIERGQLDILKAEIRVELGEKRKTTALATPRLLLRRVTTCVIARMSNDQ